MSYYFGLFGQCLPSLLSGLKVTLIIAIMSIIFAVILGLVFGIFSISKIKALETIANVYIYMIRGLPLMVLALFLFFGVGAALQVRFNVYFAAILALSINAGAFMTEIFRGGILAVDHGQMEAARSLGLSYFQAMKKVILPQAIKIMIPSILNQFITTVKDTSILSIISLRELTSSGQIIVAATYKPFEVYSYVGIMYIVIITLLTVASKKVERGLRHDNRS